MGHPSRSLEDNRAESRVCRLWRLSSKSYKQLGQEAILVIIWQRVWLLSALVLWICLRLNLKSQWANFFGRGDLKGSLILSVLRLLVVSHT